MRLAVQTTCSLLTSSWSHLRVKYVFWMQQLCPVSCDILNLFLVCACVARAREGVVLVKKKRREEGETPNALISLLSVEIE